MLKERMNVSDFVQETKAQLVRWLIHLKREPFNVAFNLLNPVILLVFMGGGLSGAGARPFGARLPRLSLGGDPGSHCFG